MTEWQTTTEWEETTRCNLFFKTPRLKERGVLFLTKYKIAGSLLSLCAPEIVSREPFVLSPFLEVSLYGADHSA